MTQTQNLFADAEASARLGDNHGYRIHGDLACLNAELAINADRRALAEQWALQLWACDAPYGGGALSGTKVAEAPLAVWADAQPQQLYAEAFARLPAGNRDYSMVLVLASGAEGSFDRVHDFANYPAREHFSVPKLRGEVSHVWEAGQVTLHIEGVENPRSEENLSGSLALEVWALEERYTGGQFVGAPLAGVELGRMAGGARLENLEHRLTLDTTAIDYPHSALMLREWTASGYVTRDFRALSLHVKAAPAPVAEVVVAKEAPAVIAEVVVAEEVPAAIAEAVVAKEAPAAIAEAVVAKEAPAAIAEVVVAKEAPAPIADLIVAKELRAPSDDVVAAKELRAPSAEAVVAKEAPKSAAVGALAAQPAASAQAVAAASNNEGLVSIGRASLDDLAIVPGLNRKLAAEIIKARPFRAFEDLTRVRGIGEKTLRRLRAVLTL